MCSLSPCLFFVWSGRKRVYFKAKGGEKESGVERLCEKKKGGGGKKREKKKAGSVIYPSIQKAGDYSTSNYPHDSLKPDQPPPSSSSS
jgi:hypothetical protein